MIEKLIYRGESENSYSKNHDAPAGIFFAVNKKDALGFGEIKTYQLNKDFNLFTYYSSDKFVSDNKFVNKNYDLLEKYFGYKSLQDFLDQRENFYLKDGKYSSSGYKEFWNKFLFME